MSYSFVVQPCNCISTEAWLRTGRPAFNSWQGQWWEFFPSLPSPDRLWGPLSLLSSGYRRFLRWE